MLWTPGNRFQWRQSNMATVSSTFGTSITTGTNTFPTPTELISAASLTEDVYLIYVLFSNYGTASAARPGLLNVYVTPPGGSQVVLIANLMLHEAGTKYRFMNRYIFPLFIKSGSAIAVAASGSGANTLEVLIEVFGKPSRPDMIACGSYVEDFGALTASSDGTEVPEGNSVKGAWTQIGTTTRECWWWQAQYGQNSSTDGGLDVWMDVAAGDATNKDIIILDQLSRGTTTEERNVCRNLNNYKSIPAGTNIYARLMTTAGISNTKVIAHGMGG